MRSCGGKSRSTVRSSRRRAISRNSLFQRRVQNRLWGQYSRNAMDLSSPRFILRDILRYAALAFSMALAGCNSDWLGARDRAITANTTPPGPNYKADVVAFMRTYLND